MVPRTIVDVGHDLVYLFGGKGNTSQVQVFDRADYVVETFYLVDDEGQRLDQRLNFVPLLLDSDDDEHTVLLMGGESNTFTPTDTIYSTPLSALSAHYDDELQRTVPLQAFAQFTTATLNTISITVEVNVVTNSVYITLDGPATKFFAVGFGANAMNDSPYTILVYGSEPAVTVAEHKLGARNAGDALSEQMLVIESMEEYSTTIDGQDTVYRAITMTRPRVGVSNDHFTFPSAEGQIEVIYAHGSSDSDVVGYHFNNRDSAQILFLDIPCTADGALCDDVEVDYCCSDYTACGEVVHYELSGSPVTTTRCCIANDDTAASCAIDGECCGDYRCVEGHCEAPQCVEDGHACDVGDCCERDIAKCAVKYFDDFTRSEQVCCVETLDTDECVAGGCCGILTCDVDGDLKCKYGQGFACSLDTECLVGMECGGGVYILWLKSPVFVNTFNLCAMIKTLAA